jgi:hypothetical protein
MAPLLQRVESRKYKGKYGEQSYTKSIVTLPNYILDVLGWKDGDSIDVVLQVEPNLNALVLKNTVKNPIDRLEFNSRVLQHETERLEKLIQKKVGRKRAPQSALARASQSTEKEKDFKEFVEASGIVFCGKPIQGPNANHELEMETVRVKLETNEARAKKAKSEGVKVKRERAEYLGDDAWEERLKQLRRKYPLFDEQIMLYKLRKHHEDEKRVLKEAEEHTPKPEQGRRGPPKNDYERRSDLTEARIAVEAVIDKILSNHGWSPDAILKVKLRYRRVNANGTNEQESKS